MKSKDYLAIICEGICEHSGFEAEYINRKALEAEASHVQREEFLSRLSDGLLTLFKDLEKQYAHDMALYYSTKGIKEPLLANTIISVTCDDRYSISYMQAGYFLLSLKKIKSDDFGDDILKSLNLN